jgi:transcriptional antiterminator RfaH
MSLAENKLYSSRDNKWIVVNTHPHKENLALRNLTRQQFFSYCPLIRKRIIHARRSQDVLRPLFPGYVFVQVDRDLSRWQPILSTIGVRALVRFGERLSFLDDGFVCCLRAREIGGAIVRPQHPFASGQEVRVSGGAFDGRVATIVTMDERDRLVVLMDILNRSVKVKVTAQNLAAI